MPRMVAGSDAHPTWRDACSRSVPKGSRDTATAEQEQTVTHLQ